MHSKEGIRLTLVGLLIVWPNFAQIQNQPDDGQCIRNSPDRWLNLRGHLRTRRCPVSEAGSR